MAISLISSPGNYAVATRPVEWVMSSNTVDVVHLIARVTIDGTVYPARIIELNPDNEYVFDISEFLQEAFLKKLRTNNYLLRSSTAATVITEPGMIVTYYVEFWDETTDVDGLLTSTYPATPGYTSVTWSALNITTLHTEDVSTDPYKASAVTPGKFLTRAPLSKRIGLNENELLSIIHTSTTGVAYMEISTYNSAGTLLGTYRISHTSPTATTVVSLPVGTATLNSLTVATVVTGSAPILTNDVAYYTARTLASTLAASSETRTFVIDRNTYLLNKRFHWRNSLGGIDSFTFLGYEIEKRKTEYKTYKKQLPSDFTERDRGAQVQQAVSNDSFEIFTDLISKTTCSWLAEIKDSSMVYIQDGTKYLPVILSGGESEVSHSSKVFEIFNLAYEYSFERQTLRG